MPGFVAAQPSLSRINSMERFSTFWRLWINSSDWVAKENECSDSEGKRDRSSPKAKVGEAGAVGVDSEGCLDAGGVLMFSEVARCVVDSCLWLGCWRMRRSPEDPRPCSCSGTMGDLMHTRQPLLSKRRMLLPGPTSSHMPTSCAHYSPCHAIQLPSIDAQALRSIDGWRQPRAVVQQARGAFRLDQRGIFGNGL